MSVLRLKIKGWEDGEPVERWLDRPDRWQLHAADQVTLVLDDMEVVINQKVRQQQEQQQLRRRHQHWRQQQLAAVTAAAAAAADKGGPAHWC